MKFPFLFNSFLEGYFASKHYLKFLRLVYYPMEFYKKYILDQSKFREPSNTQHQKPFS